MIVLTVESPEQDARNCHCSLICLRCKLRAGEARKDGSHSRFREAMAGIAVSESGLGDQGWAIKAGRSRLGWGDGYLGLPGEILVVVDVAAEGGGQILVVALVGEVEGGLGGGDGLGVLAGL